MNEKKFDVIAVGMINFDINVRLFNPEKVIGKIQEVEQISLAFGGDAQNCSATMSRLGLRTAICGVVGNDLAGDICIAYQNRTGIDTSMVSRKPVQTGTAIQLFQTAEAHVVDCAGANREFCLEDIPDTLYGASTIVSLHSFYGCGKLGAEFLKKARESGAITVADTTSLLPGDNFESIRPSLQYLDYFVPSIAEARDMTGETDPSRIADCFLANGAKNVVIKMGADGCFIKNRDIATMVKGYKVDNVLDTTGCGDSFVAGFIVGLVKGASICDCARIANAAGAINATVVGSNGGVRNYAQLVEFMKQSEMMEG